MDRQHRRDLRHDKFIDEIGNLTGRARTNQRVLYTITGAAVAIAVVVYGIYFYHTNHEAQAQAALAAAIRTIDSPLIPAAGAAPIPDAKYRTEAEKTGAALPMFQDVQKKFSGTDAADVADLYLARISASKGDVTGARKRLETFVSEHPKSVLVGSVRYSLYQLRIDNGEASLVATELNRELLKTGDEVLPSDSVLILLAHAYDAQGSSEKSRDAYRRIVTEFPDSPYTLEAQRRTGGAA